MWQLYYPLSGVVCCCMAICISHVTSHYSANQSASLLYLRRKQDHTQSSKLPDIKSFSFKIKTLQRISNHLWSGQTERACGALRMLPGRLTSHPLLLSCSVQSLIWNLQITGKKPATSRLGSIPVTHGSLSQTATVSTEFSTSASRVWSMRDSESK